MFNKAEVVNTLTQSHEELKRVISSLNDQQLNTHPVTAEGWTTKDVLSHLTAWNLQFLKDIDDILRDDTSLQRHLDNHEAVDDFNRQAVEARLKKTFTEVYTEWEASLDGVIERIGQLTDSEWCHQSGNETWGDGTPITVESLVGYRFEGKHNWAGNAGEIERNFFGGDRG